MSPDQEQVDVTVIGTGLAGMAAAIHLAKAGLRVLSIEAEANSNEAVGESLDWSAPALLDALGLPMQQLIDQDIATYKRHVVLRLRDGAEQHYTPGEWLGRAPFHIDLRTMHVDRTQLNQAIRTLMIAAGVRVLRDKVVGIETSDRRVTAIVTASGERIASAWFVDASGGAASLFARHFRSPASEYGPQKVAIWDYFPVNRFAEGTTLHTNGSNPPYMQWVWQIPIHCDTVSVGYVSPAESIKQKRREGMSVESIFRSELDRFPGLRELVSSNPPRTTSFRCRVFAGITGPNWLAVGESAAMVDPMTSNGVTAALRQAAEASNLIARFRNRRELPRQHAFLYQWRLRSLAKFFNDGIEKVLYDWPIRNRIGAFRAGDVYTIPAWSMNLVYSRLQPQGWVTTAAFATLLGSLRVAMHMLHWFCRIGSQPLQAGRTDESWQS
jgi:flavin-dependent dehydrogenase